MSGAVGPEPPVGLDRQPSLEGELIRVRPIDERDHDALYAIASDPLLWEQHPSKDRTQPAVFQRWFDDALACGGALVVVDQADERVVGTSRFHGFDMARREVEIGWTFLARSHWGGVYNAEVKDLMLRHAFDSVDAVVFRVHALNHRSQRAVRKLGAVYIRAEADPSGRGENFLFRLDRSAWPVTQAGSRGRLGTALRRLVAVAPSGSSPGGAIGDRRWPGRLRS